MKIKLLVIVFILLILKVPGNNAQTGDEILRKANEKNNVYTCIYDMEMKLVRPEKDDIVYKLRTFKKGDDKMLIRFLDPPKVVGRVFLKDGKRMWLYMPSIKKSIRVSSKQMALGGDFSHGDLMRINLPKDYNATLLRIETYKEKECYVLELKAKDRTISYDKIKYWIRKNDLFPVRQEFYTLSGKLLKIMTYKDSVYFGGQKRPKTLIMENTLKKGYMTVLTMIDMQVDVTLSDYMFKKQNLERQQ
ncbi:MAG: outer membrane lipoprotein-sorting protein [Candidatus Hodarchaeota archaeon]